MTRSTTAALILFVTGAIVFATAVAARATDALATRVTVADVPAEQVDPRSRVTRRRVTTREPISIAAAAEAAAPKTLLSDEPWTVVLLGPDDVPLAGISVAVDDEEQEKHTFTDETGTAILPWHVDRDTLKIEIDGYVPIDWVVLERRRTVVRYPDLVPLEVRFVHALTGQVLRGRGVTLRGEFRGKRKMQRDGDVFRMFPAPFARDDKDGGLFEFDPPAGYRAEDSDYLSARVSPSADALRIDVPVWPVGQLTVRVLDATGAPVANALIDSPSLSGFVNYDPKQRTDAQGLAVFRDIPMVPDETLRIDASTDDRFEIVRSPPIAPSQTFVDVTVALPAAPRARTRSSGGCGGCSMSFVSRRRPMPEGGSRDISVRVFRRDGRPARGVRVRAIGSTNDNVEFDDWAGRALPTDANGRVTLPRVNDTVSKIVAYAPGLTATVRDVDGGHGTLDVVLREEAGGSVHVRVVTPDGRPVASAEISARCVSYEFGDDWTHVRVRNGVQSATILTDADGRVTLEGIAHCDVEIEAVLGSRTADVRAEPGEDVTLVLE